MLKEARLHKYIYVECIVYSTTAETFDGGVTDSTRTTGRCFLNDVGH